MLRRSRSRLSVSSSSFITTTSAPSCFHYHLFLIFQLRPSPGSSPRGLFSLLWRLGRRHRGLPIPHSFCIYSPYKMIPVLAISLRPGQMNSEVTPRRKEGRREVGGLDSLL